MTLSPGSREGEIIKKRIRRGRNFICTGRGQQDFLDATVQGLRSLKGMGGEKLRDNRGVAAETVQTVDEYIKKSSVNFAQEKELHITKSVKSERFKKADA